MEVLFGLFMDNIECKFAFHLCINEKKSEYTYTMLAVDKEKTVKKIFLKRKGKMNKENFVSYPMISKLIDKAEIHIKNKFPHLAYALENSFWAGGNVLYDRSFQLDV